MWIKALAEAGEHNCFVMVPLLAKGVKMHMPRLWVLAADATRARIFRNVWSTHAGKADPELVLRSENKRLRDMMTDKPGRSFASVGSMRSAMGPHSDPVREDEKEFASSIAEVLECHRLAGDFDELAIFAAPQLLGDLRDVLPHGLKAVTVSEVPKNLTKQPAEEIYRAVEALELSTLGRPARD
jgi:protein required for attachment to host cells